MYKYRPNMDWYVFVIKLWRTADEQTYSQTHRWTNTQKSLNLNGLWSCLEISATIRLWSLPIHILQPRVCCLRSYRTLRKIAIVMSKSYQKLDIFFKNLPKIVIFWQFFWKNVQFLAIFWHSNGNFEEGQV